MSRTHLPAVDHYRMDPGQAPYAIEITGHLGVTVLSAFPTMVSESRGPNTLLTGLLDRSALHGVLAQIDALGLELLQIRRLTPENSPEPR